ncbi:MAG: hypothetical protein PHZ09_03260 [Eubacteriales bacterium]|nr:hypothetical protein [Eubacteriales bacterium]
MVKRFLVLLLIASMLFMIMPGCAADEGSDTETTAAEGDTAPPDVTDAPETTKAPETTPKETEPPIEYEYATVFKVDFTSMPDGSAPFSVNMVENLRIEGGLMKGTGTGGDPFTTYTGGDAVFPAESVQEIRIKLKNYSIDYNFQFFFTTETVGWSEPASYKEYLDWSGDDGDDNDWNLITIDTSYSDEWVGNITNFRLDPSSAEGDFEYEYIEFLSKTVKE